MTTATKAYHTLCITLITLLALTLGLFVGAAYGTLQTKEAYGLRHINVFGGRLPVK